MKPSWRKPAGILAILILIAALATVIGSFADEIGQLPAFLQGLIYLFCGIVWIVPLRPLLSWMETGHFRKPRD
jgi:hypothetical protein